MGTRIRNLAWFPLFVSLSLPPLGCGAGLAGREAPPTAAAPGNTSVSSMLIVAKPREGEEAARQTARPTPYGTHEPRQEGGPYRLVSDPLACLVRHECLLPLNLHTW